MPTRGAECRFVCRSHYFEKHGQIDQVVLALGCISTHRPVAGGVSWHTVRAFSNDAVVVEKDRGRRAKKGECEGTGQYCGARQRRAQFFRRVGTR